MVVSHSQPFSLPRNNSLYQSNSAIVTCKYILAIKFWENSVLSRFLTCVFVMSFFRFHPCTWCLSRFEGEVDLLVNGGYRNLKKNNLDFLWIVFLIAESYLKRIQAVILWSGDGRYRENLILIFFGLCFIFFLVDIIFRSYSVYNFR